MSGEFATAKMRYALDRDLCVDCGRPVWYDDGQWLHVDPVAECFLCRAWGVIDIVIAFEAKMAEFGLAGLFYDTLHEHTDPNQYLDDIAKPWCEGLTFDEEIAILNLCVDEFEARLCEREGSR